MKQFIFLLGILFSLLLTNCNKSSNQHSNSDITTENIRLVDNSYNDLKSALVDSIHILKLNENEESFFVTISKVMTYNDTIYVFDRFGRDLLISFDRNGNYITKFSQKGGGPEEYARLWDFDVDSNYVYLYDRAAQRMLFYDHAGNFVKSHSTTFRGDAFVALKNNEFLFSLAKENDNKKVCIVDSTLSVKQTLLSYQKEDNDDRITDNLFQKVNGMIYYNKVVNDSVYVFSNQGHILNCYYFNFNDNNVPDEEKYSYDKLTSFGFKVFFSKTLAFSKDLSTALGIKPTVCNLGLKTSKRLASAVVTRVASTTSILDINLEILSGLSSGLMLSTLYCKTLRLGSFSLISAIV